jgi:hypothetical protein
MTLLGYLNGAEVRFDFSPDSHTFKAEVPKSTSGVYILELHLTDDAGNTSSDCSAIVCIDFDKMNITILDMNFPDRQLNDGYSCQVLSYDFEDVFFEEDYEMKPLPFELSSKELS